MINNNVILAIAIPTIVVASAILFKDKMVGNKFRFAFKCFFSMVINIAAMYIYKGPIGALLGLSTSLITVTSFDKDFSDRFIVEVVKVVVMQLLVGIAAYFASYNYVALIIISLILVFVIYYVFTHNGKASRAISFLMTYALLIDLNVKRSDYSTVFMVLFASAILALLMYYFFSRNTHFKNQNIFNNNFKEGFKIFIEDVDSKNGFSKFKFTYSILTSIAYTIAIVYMNYYKSTECIWVIITMVGMMIIPDETLTGRKIIDRVIGTIVGGIFFLILHKFIPNVEITYILIVVAFFFITFPTEYQYNAIFITYVSLTIHSMISKFTPDYLVEYRIGFTIVGAIVVLLIFLINNQLKKYENKNIEIEEIERQLQKLKQLQEAKKEMN